MGVGVLLLGLGEAVFICLFVFSRKVGSCSQEVLPIGTGTWGCSAIEGQSKHSGGHNGMCI